MWSVNTDSGGFLPGTVISEDVRCTHCGYNLRGLTTGKLCPECGTPVDRSLLGNDLRYSDPDWLERLRFGTSLKLWNIGLAILLGLAAVVLVAIGVPNAVMVLAALLGTALGLWAAFVITTQEPRVSMVEDPLALRKVVRGCAVLAAVGSLMQKDAELGGGLVVGIIGGVLSLAGIVQYFGEFVYYRRFARRVPDERLAKSTTTVMWGTVISLAVMAVGGLILLVSNALSAPPASGPAPLGPSGATLTGMGIFVCVGGVSALVFLLWYVRLLYKYRDAFKTAAEQVRQFAAGHGE